MLRKQVLKYLFIINLIIAASSCADKCDDVVCFNSGVCEDGECNCPLSFTGESCETPVEAELDVRPTEATFHSVRLTDFPEKRGSLDWDLAACNGIEPDIYLTIEDDNRIIFVSEVFKNCVKGRVYTFNEGVPFISTKPYSTYVFRLYDEDNHFTCGTADQYMTGMQRKLTDSKSELQTSVSLSNSSEEIAIELTVSYK